MHTLALWYETQQHLATLFKHRNASKQHEHFRHPALSLPAARTTTASNSTEATCLTNCKLSLQAAVWAAGYHHSPH